MENWEEVLRKSYPLPDTNNIESYIFPVDGGGRDLIINYLNENKINLMIEVGCFLCGSSIQWLEATNDLKVIGIDPWNFDFASLLDKYKLNSDFNSCFSRITDIDTFIESVRRHGPYASSIANIRNFGNRFIPVKNYSPQVLYELANLKIKPGLIYFDSNKILEDLEISLKLFPDAVLCGDDWSWGANQGFPVQQAVKSFCEKYKFKVISKDATWIIEKNIKKSFISKIINKVNSLKLMNF